MGETLFVDEVPAVRHRLMGIVRGIIWVGVISMISITGYTIYLEGISADRWLLHHVHQETADMRDQPVEHTVSWPSGGISAFPAAAYMDRVVVWSNGILSDPPHLDRLYPPNASKAEGL